MSDLIRCDGCLSTLVIDRHGQDADGECAAWVQIVAFEQTFDACTTTCAVDILNDDVIQSALADYTTTVMRIATIVKEADDE